MMVYHERARYYQLQSSNISGRIELFVDSHVTDRLLDRGTSSWRDGELVQANLQLASRHPSRFRSITRTVSENRQGKCIEQLYN